MADERFVAVHLRPWPKSVSIAEIVTLGRWRHDRTRGDRCLLYYNEPWTCPGFLSLNYVVSTRDTTLKTALGALTVLDEIARLKQTDAIVAAKVRRALGVKLRPIVCVGETLDERESGRTAEVVTRQVAALLEACSVAELAQGAIAYEPVWAIGTGRTATPAQAQEVHAAIRAQLAVADAAAAGTVRILYGGSVKAANAAELFAQPDIDGGLIGGASLVAADFIGIVKARTGT